MLAFRVVLFFLLIPRLCAAAEAAEPLQGVRFGQHQAFARVVFDLQEQGAYHVVSGTTPETIVIEFPTMQQLPAQTAWSATSPLVQNVHFIAGPTNVRAEIRLRQSGYVYRHFRMAAPARVIVDISPGHGSESDSTRQQVSDESKEQSSRQQASTEGKAQPTPRAVLPASPEVKVPATPPSEPAVPHAAQVREIPLTLSAEQLLSKAEREWASKQYEASQLSYNTFLVRFPQHAQNHLIATRLADILRVQAQYREALDAYAKVIETYPHSEGALISRIRLAELHMTAPNLIPAADVEPRYVPYVSPLPALQQLIADYPLHSLAQMARYTVGLLLLQRHDTVGALEIFRQLLDSSLAAPLRQEVGAKFRETLQHLIAEQTQQGEHLTALRLFFSHKGALPAEEITEPRLLLLVVQSYAGLGLLDEAANLLQMLLEKPDLTPESRAEAALEYATMLLKNGQIREAKAQVTALKELPNAALDRRRRRVLGEIALDEQQPAAAARYLQRLADLFETVSEQARMQARLAQAYANQGEVEQALQAWQRCAALAAQDDTVPAALAEDCLFHTGRLHFAQQHYQQTLTVFETLLHRFPENSRRDWVHFYMAESYRQLEDEPHMLEHVQVLLDNADDPFWQQIATEYAQSAAWRERFHERLATFHNTLTR